MTFMLFTSGSIRFVTNAQMKNNVVT